MLIVGERINTSQKPIAEATEKRDSPFILREAKLQEEAGAHLIDVNVGTFAEKEKEHLLWLVEASVLRRAWCSLPIRSWS